MTSWSMRADGLVGNGSRVPLDFDAALYERLLALLPDCRNDVARA